MKISKLVMTTILATVAAIGISAELSEAASLTDIGNIASGGRFNEVELDYQFKIFTLTPTGQPRVDKDGDRNNNTGIFTAAIEEFQGGIDDVDDHFVFNEIEIVKSVEAVSKDEKPIFFADPLTLDLTAKFISSSSIIRLPNNKPAICAGSNCSKKKIIATSNRIEYTFTGNELEDEGIIELTLIVEDIRDIDDPIQAVNSIEYIIDNKLFGKVNRIRVSGISSKSSRKILSNEDRVNEDGVDDGPPVKAEVLPPRMVGVPESSPVNAWLASGILSAALLLKRKQTNVDQFKQ